MAQTSYRNTCQSQLHPRIPGPPLFSPWGNSGSYPNSHNTQSSSLLVLAELQQAKHLWRSSCRPIMGSPCGVSYCHLEDPGTSHHDSTLVAEKLLQRS